MSYDYKRPCYRQGTRGYQLCQIQITIKPQLSKHALLFLPYKLFMQRSSLDLTAKWLQTETFLDEYYPFHSLYIQTKGFIIHKTWEIKACEHLFFFVMSVIHSLC